MPLTYQIDIENSVVLLEGSGAVSDEEMVSCVARLRDDPDLDPNMATLADMRGIKAEVTRQGMHDLVDVLARTADRRGSARAAVLVNDPLSFGMTRMLATLSDSLQPEIKVFEDEDAAHAWLGG